MYSSIVWVVSLHFREIIFMVIPQIVKADFLGQKNNKLKTNEIMSSRRHDATAVYCKIMKQPELLAGPSQVPPPCLKLIIA